MIEFIAQYVYETGNIDTRKLGIMVNEQDFAGCLEFDRKTGKWFFDCGSAELTSQDIRIIADKLEELNGSES